MCLCLPREPVPAGDHDPLTEEQLTAGKKVWKWLKERRDYRDPNNVNINQDGPLTGFPYEIAVVITYATLAEEQLLRSAVIRQRARVIKDYINAELEYIAGLNFAFKVATTNMNVNGFVTP